MFFGKIREPVLSIVKEILEDPSKHGLRLISENHIGIHFRKDSYWRISIADHGLGMWRSDTAEWMTAREARYLYKNLRHLFDEQNMRRSGWITKVEEKNNEQ